MRQHEKTSSNPIKEALEFLKKNKRYLLSHHLPKDNNRCLTAATTKICARCAGIYISIIISILFTEQILSQPILVLFAIPGLVEWTAHRWKGISLNAEILFVNGFLMGVAYSYFLFNILRNQITIEMISIVAIYFGIFTLIILAKKKKYRKQPTSRWKV